MKNLLLVFCSLFLLSSCFSGKYTAYSANSPEGQSWKKYSTAGSTLTVSNKTSEEKTVSIKYLFPEGGETRHTVSAGQKLDIDLHRGVCLIGDNRNDPIKLDVAPCYKYKMKLK